MRNRRQLGISAAETFGTEHRRWPKLPGKFRIEAFWIWVGAAVLGLAVAWVLLARERSLLTPQPLALHVLAEGSELQVTWDNNSPRVENAARGLLEVTDAGSTIPISLDPDTLRTGSFIYMRKSPGVAIRLTVYPRSGQPMRESVMFIGPALTPPAEEEALREQRDQLAAQIVTLKEALQREYVRNRELQAAVSALENRVQIQSRRGSAARAR